MGIGVSNPSAKLQIGGTAGSDGIRFPDGSLQTTAYSAGSISALHASDGSPTNVVAADSTGNVSIGPTSGEFGMVDVTGDYRAQSWDGGFWQSFTATESCNIGSVDFFMGITGDGGSRNISMSLHQGTGTGGPILVSFNFTLSGYPTYNTVTFPGSTMLTAGQVYTISVAGPADFRADTLLSDIYSGGRSSVAADRDFWFRVRGKYPEVPGITVQSYTGRVGIGTTTPAYQLQLSTDSAAKPGSSSWTVSSDARLKDVGGNFGRGLEAIDAIQPVQYHYKSGNPLGLPSDREFVGVIAQEVGQAVPEAVREDNNGFLTVTTDPIFWTMVNAIKQLKAALVVRDSTIQELKNSQDELRRKNAALELRMQRLEEAATQSR